MTVTSLSLGKDCVLTVLIGYPRRAKPNPYRNRYTNTCVESVCGVETPPRPSASPLGLASCASSLDRP